MQTYFELSLGKEHYKTLKEYIYLQLCIVGCKISSVDVNHLQNYVVQFHKDCQIFDQIFSSFVLLFIFSLHSRMIDANYVLYRSVFSSLTKRNTRHLYCQM
jgi:hypothetical protein